MTATGTYAQINATDGSVRRQATVLDEPAGEIVMNGGAIFAVSRDELVRIHLTGRASRPTAAVARGGR